MDAQGERLVLFFSELLGAITHCISDIDPVVRERAGEANKDLLELVQVNENDSAILRGVCRRWPCTVKGGVRGECPRVLESVPRPVGDAGGTFVGICTFCFCFFLVDYGELCFGYLCVYVCSAARCRALLVPCSRVALRVLLDRAARMYDGECLQGAVRR